jgi:superfamily II helicase
VCAPTGSGMTVIAEYAVEMALRSNSRCYYTTPLKALSNQKLYDFRQKYGDDKVGLLTGDTSINREAPIVVMTTEVFRNMLYGTILGAVSKNLHNVSSVILDECHYMNDSERGTVWEESIIYSPKDIQLVALSATVANARSDRACPVGLSPCAFALLLLRRSAHLPAFESGTRCQRHVESAFRSEEVSAQRAQETGYTGSGCASR